jgi:hypothetical protein
MKRFSILIIFMSCLYLLTAQEKTSPWLEELIRSKASSFLLNVLNQPDTFQYQLIYTEINRDKNNQPHLKNYYLHVNKNRYFNPASMVKLPVALMALEKINKLGKAGINKYTPIITDSGFGMQTKVTADTSSENGLPSIAHYVRKIFLVSDNDAYNRLYEFVGQKPLNERLWAQGYKDSRITRRFVTMTEEQNRHTNPIRFMNDDKILYEQPGAYSDIQFDFGKKILVGNAHYNRNDSLINEPMDFTTHNNMPLEDLQQILQSGYISLFSIRKQRYNITDDDYRFLYQYMSEFPSESKFPNYDTTEYFDSYTKFFIFKADRLKPPSNMRMFNKTGWSYGYLTDVAYIVDFKNKVEFMLSAVIYTNRDGILNDNKYEYDTIGYPFFKQVGTIIYYHELMRQRKFKPDLSNFVLDYK